MLTSKIVFCLRCVFANRFPPSYCRSVHSSQRIVKTLVDFHVYNTFNLTRMSMSTMTGHKDIFKLTDYDCVGFDLDNTLCKYKVKSMIKMEYEILSNFLVERKGYDAKHLLKPLDKEWNYIQKGLMLDFQNGNILQIGRDGSVLRACHGTRLLNDEEVVVYYGQNRKWNSSVEFCKDMLGAWNGPLAQKLRTLLDSFDMPVSLAFARIIDTLDENAGNKLENYNIWPDILDGLLFMYERDNFAANNGGYFPSLKANPEQYINKCSDRVISWLKSVKEHSKTFLLTGSNVDFASLVARNSLGKDWLDYFDIVVCYARKPGFFTSSRPFLAIDNLKETHIVKAEDLQLNGIYSQGNWKELHQFFSEATGKENPKSLYIGDNLIQDIYVPSKHINLDTVAIVDTLPTEEGKQPSAREDTAEVSSGPWTSYFGGGKQDISIWSDILCTCSRICVPSVDVLAEHPIDYPWTSFNHSNSDRKCGFHPKCPVNLL